MQPEVKMRLAFEQLPRGRSQMSAAFSDGFINHSPRPDSDAHRRQ